MAQVERFPALTANAHLAIDQRLKRQQTGIAAPGEFAVMDHQRNLGAQIQARQLRAHAQRERRAAQQAALFCFSDTSQRQQTSTALYPSARQGAIGHAALRSSHRLALDEKAYSPRAWSTMLCEKIKNAQAAGEPDTGETYYHHWLVTLEQMVAENGGTSAQTLAQH
jgi:nitrile hydratase accessory protein